MAFKMNGWSGFKKQKVTYDQAYENRDMKIYGSLNKVEYIAEAKRQNRHKNNPTKHSVSMKHASVVNPYNGRTREWDAPTEPMTSSTIKTIKPTKLKTTKPTLSKPKTTKPKEASSMKERRKKQWGEFKSKFKRKKKSPMKNYKKGYYGA
tara:strand:+ start:2335 stop:2784 length:450 start_codon:yes stop_codon:yes gene_type:complete